MEFILIHEPNNLMTPDMLAASVEMGKKLMAKPEELVPGGKMLFSYHGRNKSVVFCLWEVPSLDVLLPVLEQMTMIGWNNEIIPVETMEVHLEKAVKAMEAMKAK